MELKERTKEAEAQLHKGPASRDQSVDGQQVIKEEGAEDELLVKAKAEVESNQDKEDAANREEDSAPDVLVKAKPTEEEAAELRKTEGEAEDDKKEAVDNDKLVEEAKEDIKPGKNEYLDRFRQHMCRVVSSSD